jgi:hypothetical protein
MTEERLICESFGLTKEQSSKLIDKYGRKPFEAYLKGEIQSGDLISAFIDLDELTTNEKCFLTSHLTQSMLLAQSYIKKQMMIANLLGDGIP